MVLKKSLISRRRPVNLISIYILLVCLGVSLCTINVKTYKPIGPIYCVGPHMTPSKYKSIKWLNFKKIFNDSIWFLYEILCLSGCDRSTKKLLNRSGPTCGTSHARRGLKQFALKFFNSLRSPKEQPLKWMNSLFENKVRDRINQYKSAYAKRSLK